VFSLSVMAAKVALYTTEPRVYIVKLFLKCNTANCLETFKSSWFSFRKLWN